MTINVQYEIISSSRQGHWKWPAVANFFLGGAGAGLCFIANVHMLSIRTQDTVTFYGYLHLIAMLMIVSGLSVVSLEAGRPSRGFHVLTHFSKSWISREIVCFIVLLASVILQLSTRSLLFVSLSMLSAIGFIVSQAFIVHRSEALPVWKRPEVPLFFLSSGLASGWGAIIVINALMEISMDSFAIISGMVLIVLNAIVWIFFITLKQKDGTGSLMSVLRKPLALLFPLGAGFVLPCALLIIMIINPLWLNFKAAYMIAGAGIMSGIAVQKKNIIISLGYLNNIVIPVSKSV